MIYLYKLVDKVLANRLGMTMDKIIISHNQSTSLKGRMLVDGVVAVNEVIYLAKRYKKTYLIFKVDFEKVYISISSIFMDYMLIIFGFNDK